MFMLMFSNIYFQNHILQNNSHYFEIKCRQLPYFSGGSEEISTQLDNLGLTFDRRMPWGPHVNMERNIHFNINDSKLLQNYCESVYKLYKACWYVTSKIQHNDLHILTYR